MYKIATWAMLVATLYSAPQVKAADCKPGNEIWVSDGESGLRTVVYSVGAAGISSPRITFEGWRGKQIVWRISGQKYCSNGVVICGVEIPLTNGKSVEAPVEEIYEAGEPRYLVFAQLSQATFRAQVYDADGTELEAKWFLPKPTVSIEDGPAIVLPSSYRFIGCLEGDELDAGQNG